MEASLILHNGKIYTVDKSAPSVISVKRASPSPTSAASVKYTVKFSEAVTGVDASDFTFTTTGSLTGYAVTNVSGSGDTYTVTVGTGMNSGTLKLNVANNGSIKDTATNALASAYTSGETFTIGKVYTLTFKSGGKQDGWILEKDETSGKGGTKNSKSKLLYVGDDAENRQYRAILSFQTASEPIFRQ